MCTRTDTNQQEVGASSNNNMSLLSRCLEEQALVTKKQDKRVRFSTVEVREYALVIGDHPACPDGLALSLDWNYSPETTVENVLAREDEKACSPPPRRLGYMDRRLRLQQASSEKEEIQRFLKEEQVKSALREEQSRTHRGVIELDETPNVTVVPLQ